MNRFVTLAINFFLIAIPTLTLAQVEASFQGLGDLSGGEAFSIANDVSADGSVVVGISGSEEGNEAFRWESGEIEGLGDLEGGDFYSEAYAVSADGSVVVGYGKSLNAPGTWEREAWRWTESNGMEGLGDFPGGDFYSEAQNVSADGSVIIGQGSWDEGYEAFRWEDDELEALGDLEGGTLYSTALGVSPDGSVIVGFSDGERGYEAFRWEGGEMVGLGDLEGEFFYSEAQDVSADGSIIVGLGTSGGSFGEAYRWENGEMTGLGFLPGGDPVSWARAVSADGSVIVGQSGSEENPFGEAFMWTEEEGMRSLKEVLEEEYALDLSGWTLIDARSISSDGTVIVGTGTNPDGNDEAWRAVIPHPVADEATPDAIADVLSIPSPNPARGRTSSFTVAVEHGQHVAVEVFDVMGRHVQTVYEGTLAGGMSERLTLDASALPAGVYMIRATGEDFSRTRRVTVVR